VMILTGQGPGDSGFVAAAPQYPASSQYPTTTSSPYYGWPPVSSYGPYGPSNQYSAPDYWMPGR
jgi:hypothetical protein